MTVQRTTFSAIGTTWDIQVVDRLPDDEWSSLLERVHDRIGRFDRTYSRFRPDSLVSTMAHQAGRHELPDDGFVLLQFYEQLYRATAGKVTPLIGATMEAAGYDANYSLLKGRLHRPPAWNDAISYDEASITLSRPALLDFGAAGKGYLVDLLSHELAERGITSYTINAGGDIVHRSAANLPLRVGLENPLDPSEAIGIATIGNQSLCASAGSKRTWQDMHHIIDPQDLTSPQSVLATWVIADQAMVADGLATALFFVPPERLQQFDYQYAVLLPDMSLNYAKTFPVELFQESRHADD